MSGPGQIGAYLVEETLGRGAMGSVYLATHPALRVPVAIKVLHDRSPDVAARFAREGRVMARIKHPNVVEVLEGGVQQGEPFLVMEYCPGLNLQDYVKERGRLEPGEAATLVAQAARGVAAAHALGSIHRDLKPANVMLSEGRVKVTDFGIASAVRAPGAEQLTRTGEILGTPAYMAPEQLDDARAVDPRSDVYALGAILFELLAGTPPFRGASLFGVVRKVIEGEREPLPAGLPVELLEVLDCAMAPDPAARFASAELLAEALEEFAAVHAGASRAARRSSPLLALGLVGMGVLALGAGGAGTYLLLADSPEPLAERPSRSSSPALSPSPATTPSPAPSSGLPGPKSRADYALREEVLAAPLERLWELSNRGYPPATCALARRYERGAGAPVDLVRARELWERAAAEGSLAARTRLGELAVEGGRRAEGLALLQSCSEEGSFQASEALAALTEDEGLRERALEQAKLAAAAGDPSGAAFAGGRHLLRIEWDAAEEWLRKGIELGSRLAEIRWAILRAHQFEVSSEDRARALGLLEAGAREGQPEAIAALARLSFLGKWVPRGEGRADQLCDRLESLGERDAAALWRARFAATRGKLAEARRHFEQVSRKDWGEALATQGVLEFKVGMTKIQTGLSGREEGLSRLRAAREIFERALGAGTLERDAYFLLGTRAYRGLGAEQDFGLAARCFRKAARFGDPEAVYAWGECLLLGKGVPADAREALEVLAPIAPRFPLAYWRMGQAHQRGLGGLEVNVAQGLELYRRGAAALDPDCMVELGRASEARGDLVQARKLFNDAGKGRSNRGLFQTALYWLEGKGGPARPERGRRLLLQIAEVYTPAAREAIRRAEAGEGLPRDPALLKRLRAQLQSLEASGLSRGD